jgi:ring-1,2-phenylacetyl-CoA epoxidase subunit PaaE
MTTPAATDDRHFHALRVASVQPEGEGALVLGFELPEALAPLYRFQPGQYLTLRRPPAPGASDDLRRAYSICAGPGEPLRVGIRRLPGGAFSGWVHQQLRPGALLDVMPPQGRFGALLAAPPATTARHVLAVAAGSGITPILAIVKAVLADAQGGRVTLVTVNRSPASSMFHGELQDLKDRYLGRLTLHALYTREQADTPAAEGRLDAPRLAQLLRLAGGAAGVSAAFVCGPARFNDEIVYQDGTAAVAAGQGLPARHPLPADFNLATWLQTRLEVLFALGATTTRGATTTTGSDDG